MLNIDFQSDSETEFGGKMLAQAVESILLLPSTHLPQSAINGSVQSWHVLDSVFLDAKLAYQYSWPKHEARSR